MAKARKARTPAAAKPAPGEPAADDDDPREAVAALAGSTAPWLFGVRHHSPACAAALPPLLDALRPAVVAIELPADLGQWLEWLGADTAKAPLALAAVGADGADLGFYPFADFSPELAAIRWARTHGVPAVAIDLPAAAKAATVADDHDGAPIGLTDRLVRHHQTEDSESLWDELVESRAVGAEPEQVRRAALLYGWALRIDHARGGGVSRRDLHRETHMRDAIAAAGAGGQRVAAIVGAFHAAALLDPPRLWRDPGPAPARADAIVSSLIPYGFDLLDSRSGYPAGIRDPMWQQRRFTALAKSRDASGPAIRSLAADILVEIVRDVRRANHPAGVPDAQAAWQLATSLAHLRGLPAPGHREVVEAAQSALTQGELLGRGRIVARAMERIMVGRRRGELAHGTPRSGLHPHVVALLDELRLPGPGATSADPTQLRLDPLRSTLDRRRHVALNRLAACGIPYARPEASTAVGGVETLTQSWTVRWQPSTDAMLELAGIRGVTLRQAAAGGLRAERTRLTDEEGAAIGKLIGLTIAAGECGLHELVRDWLAEIGGPLLGQATLPDLIGLIAFVERARAGHVIGLPTDAADAIAGELEVFAVPSTYDDAAVVAAAVRCVEGLGGSNDIADARALLELVRRLTSADGSFLGDARLAWAITAMIKDGSPLMQGAATVLAAMLDRATAADTATAIGGWLDGAVDADGQRALAARLRGALAVAGPIVEASPVLLAPLADRLEAIGDDDFLRRLPALRDGFDVLSTAARRRLLEVLAERLGEIDVTTVEAPERLALYAAADAEGRAAMDRIANEEPRTENRELRDRNSAFSVRGSPFTIRSLDRWRLVLGHQRDKLTAKGARAARALDELYGVGHGEGSRAGLGPGGGQGQGFPTAREWTDEIEALFGTAVREEVTAAAASRGRVHALFEVDPDEVVPSIDLLEQILSLRGGLAEAHLARLRPLVRRIVDALVAELAVRVRPALVGLASPRAGRRAIGPLHLPRTIAANLHTARITGDRVTIAPEQLFFRTRSRRHLDWRVILIVDVSGSMEPSVIYSAMMAAILAGVPWVDVRFLAFSTEVIDLSDRVGDPLALLLEVEVGGGTHIARALRAARTMVEIPQRTIAIVVSDFEEGFAIEPMLAEVRALVESGVKCLGLAALDDRGAPRYAVPIAELVAGCGMPVAALTPLELARWVGEKIR